MCSTGPFSLEYLDDIHVLHCIIIIKLIVSIFAIGILCFNGCVYGMVALSYSVSYFLEIFRRWVFVSTASMQSIICSRGA